jgi:hypothetical protein
MPCFADRFFKKKASFNLNFVGLQIHVDPEFEARKRNDSNEKRDSK